MKWTLAAFVFAAGICSARVYGDSKSALTTAQIDHMVRAQWNADNVIPAPPVDDARFLRRAYLDIVGKIPTADVVRAAMSGLVLQADVDSSGDVRLLGYTLRRRDPELTSFAVDAPAVDVSRRIEASLR